MYGNPFSVPTPITRNDVPPPPPTAAELSRECPHIGCVNTCMYLSYWHLLMASKNTTSALAYLNKAQ